MTCSPDVDPLRAPLMSSSYIVLYSTDEIGLDFTLQTLMSQICNNICVTKLSRQIIAERVNDCQVYLDPNIINNSFNLKLINV
jgi:hypothetical protein